MKRNHSNPQQLAHDIVDMNCRNLVIYCHPSDEEYANELLTSLYVLDALIVVNCVATIKVASLVERGLFILAKDNVLTVDTSVNITTAGSHSDIARIMAEAARESIMRNVGYVPAPKFDAVQIGRKAYEDFVGSGAISKIRKGEDPFALDPNLEPIYDTIMNRVNAHQLAQEEMENVKSGVPVILPIGLYERMHEFEPCDNNTDAYFQLLLDLRACIMAQIKE